MGLAKRHDQRGKREQPIKQLTLPWSIKEYPLNLFSTSSPNPSKSTLIKLASELNGITFFCSRHNLSSLSLSSEINKIKRDQVIIVNRGEMENTLIGRNNRDKGNRNGGCMRVITKESSLDRDESHKLGSLRSLR